MNEISSLINILALTQLSGSNTTNQCNCGYNNSSGFDMIMMTLLKHYHKIINKPLMDIIYHLILKIANELDSVANNTVGKFIEVDTKDKV